MPHRPALLRCTLAALLLAAGTAQFTIAQSARPPSRKSALVVGVSHYSSSSLPELRYASTDAKEMAATLKSQGFRVETLINKDATRTNVLRSLEKLRNRTSHGDVGLFYFSGHGLQLGDNSYISPYDATADHSLLGVDEIQNSLFSAAGTAMIVLDACETGRHSDDSHPSMTSTVRTLFSSQFGSASYESDRLGHGIFTYYLLRGLQGNAADDRGLITWNSLTDFVVRNVSAAKAPEGIPQIPHVVGPTSKDVVIGVSPPTVLVTSNTGGPNAAGRYNSGAVV